MTPLTSDCLQQFSTHDTHAWQPVDSYSDRESAIDVDIILHECLEFAQHVKFDEKAQQVLILLEKSTAADTARPRIRRLIIEGMVQFEQYSSGTFLELIHRAIADAGETTKSSRVRPIVLISTSILSTR